MRSICYISGTRADFGLMQSTLERIHQSEDLDLSICVTGMHLSDKYSTTVNEIVASGLRVGDRVSVDVDDCTGKGMSVSLGMQVVKMTEFLDRERPDLVLLLGDRGEMLAGAISALHLGIPVAHIHGGELSGTVDESIRHAISKLSHYHFASTEQSRDRLIKMGELPEHIHVTGAPGLDGLMDQSYIGRTELCEELKIDAAKPVALVVFHPVVQTASESGEQFKAVIEGALAAGVQLVILMPNSDAGGDYIRDLVPEYESKGLVSAVSHFPRSKYISWLACCDVLIGNSSSGIIEAASFKLPVVNVGDRQQRRERNKNVIDVDVDLTAVKEAVLLAINDKDNDGVNIYGDGHAGERIVELLTHLPLNKQLLNKCNAY